MHRSINKLKEVLILALAFLLAIDFALGKDPEIPFFAPALLVPVHVRNKYDEHRASLKDLIHQSSFAYNVRLSDEEIQLDRYLHTERTNYLANDMRDGKSLSKLSFLEARDMIETNRVFKIMQRMPKGGLLHVHDVSVGRAEWLVTNATRRSDCYIHWPELKLNFQPTPPACTNCIPAAELWKCVPDLQQQLMNAFRLVPGPHGETGWTRFGQCFTALGNLQAYWPVFEEYLIDAFSHLYKDGVPYVELRLVLNGPRKENQGQLDLELIQRYWDLRNKIRETYADFDLKLILCGLRLKSDPIPASDLIERAGKVQIDSKLPGFVVGCDFVGDEDGGRTTFHDALPIAVAMQDFPDLQLFLHDGESAWYHDENLIDAVLLRPTRIGHAFNLYRYNLLEEKIKMDRVALEICPISNQLLELTPDLRTHPAPGYMARGVQCVLSSDDPLMFGNNGLSYDFWMAYHFWGLNLASVKKLAHNSLRYSAMNATEKAAADQRWQERWTEWVAQANRELGTP